MSCVVANVNVTAPAAGFTARAPLPVVHVNVVGAAAMGPDVTVNTRIRSDVVAADTDPTLLVHVGSIVLI